MKPGGDTLTFVSKGGTQRDSMGNRIVVENSNSVAGCLFQPRRLDDTISDTQFASSTHLAICPVTPVVLAVKPEDRIVFGGVSHRVIGKKVHRDWFGRISHVKVMCEEQSS